MRSVSLLPFDDGTTRLVCAGKALDIVTENSIDEGVFASPAISQGQIFIKGDHHLFCISQMIFGLRIAVNNMDKRRN